LRKGLIQAGKFIAFLVIGILLLWIAFRTVDFEALKESLKGANYYWLILSTFLGLLGYLSRTRRWIILINPLGYHPKYRNTFHSMMSGNIANLALPRIGEITRCVALGKKEKIPVDQLIGTMVIERTIDLISLLVIMFGLFITSGSKIRGYLNESIIIPFREKVLSVFGAVWIPWAIFIAFAVISLLGTLFSFSSLEVLQCRRPYREE